jgi:surface antigen
MRLGGKNEKLFALAAILSLSTPFAAHAATKTATHHHVAPTSRTDSSSHTHSSQHATRSHAIHASSTHTTGTVSARHSGIVHASHVITHHHDRAIRVAYHGVQCVTFARADTGIVLKGNAVDWWSHAAGVYQRGSQPEVGSVLNFRANSRMRLGHVAVVSNVIDARTVELDQANWTHSSLRHGGAVTHGTLVVDVSPNNDWTAVRVGLDHAGDYGSIYPTFGFIYNRPDNGSQIATNVAAAAPANTKSAAPSDLRRGGSYDEVAEAPDTNGIDAGATLGQDAPDRAIQ